MFIKLEYVLRDINYTILFYYRNTHHFFLAISNLWNKHRGNVLNGSGMRLVHNYYGSFNSAKLDVDVTYDGENYYISNAKGTYAVTDISELMYTEEILTIPEYLVAVGRPSDK